MEYLRYDVVQPAKEPHIKSTGVTKQESAGMPYHIRHDPSKPASTFFNCAKELQPYFKVSAILT